jgi:hypothetical protein
MTTQKVIIALFYTVDHEMLDVPKHPDAPLPPRAVVTLARLHASIGGETVPVTAGCRALIGLGLHGPARTSLALLCKTHTAWTMRLLATPTGLGVTDSDGIALLHPKRAGRHAAQRGTKGKRLTFPLCCFDQISCLFPKRTT